MKHSCCRLCWTWGSGNSHTLGNCRFIGFDFLHGRSLFRGSLDWRSQNVRSRGWWSSAKNIFYFRLAEIVFLGIVRLVSSKIVNFITLSFFIDVVVSVGLTRPVDDGLTDDNLTGLEFGRSMSGISLSSSGVLFSSEYGSSISSSGSISNSGTSGASGTSWLVNGTSGPFPVTSSGHGTYEQGASIRFRPAQNSFSITSTPKNGSFQTFNFKNRIYSPLRHVLYL